MAGGGGGVEDHETISAGNYSQLLLSDEESCYNFAAAAFSSDQNPPRMMCFGPDDHFNREKCDLFFEEVGAKLAEKAAGVTCSSGGGGGGGGHPSPVTVAFSPGASSTNVNKNAAEAGAGRSNPVRGVTPAAAMDQQRSTKKARVADYSPAATPRHAKVKKEKLGERIMALQQLVSPFGKTDTASVLQEASGYIRFLQDQVQALCSPYLQRLPPPAHLLAVKEEEGAGKDLRSVGLCLVPADLTAHVAEANGADLWAPGSTSFRMTSHR